MAQFSRPLGAMAFRLVGPALLIILAAACGTGHRAATRPATTPSATARPAATQHVTAIPGPAIRPSAPAAAGGPVWTLVPSAKRKKFLAALTAIDRPLTADDAAALAHAVEICFKYYDGTPDEGLRAYARRAYSGGGTTTVSPAAAREIVTATKKWVCPAGGLHRRWQS